MAEVVSAAVLTCPSCQVQGLVRMWACGCQGAVYAEHPVACKQPRPYFDVFVRGCQKIDTHGANPQTH